MSSSYSPVFTTNSQQSGRHALTNDEQEPRPSAEKIERDGAAHFREQPRQFGHGPDRPAVDGDDDVAGAQTSLCGGTARSHVADQHVAGRILEIRTAQTAWHGSRRGARGTRFAIYRHGSGLADALAQIGDLHPR